MRVCETIAAGVASSIYELVTAPTAMPRRLARLVMVSTAGCARLLAAREQYTPSALTQDLWPVV